MGIELKGLLIATSLVNKVKCKSLPVLFSAGDRHTYFNIPPPLSVDLGLLNLALFIAKELEN